MRDQGSVHANYEVLEYETLSRFFHHIEQNQDATWIHWNMRDSHYGFSALDHRFRVLAGIPFAIPEERRLNLADLLPDIYGTEYMPHRRLENLMKRNGITSLDFLPGKLEAEAFEAGEFSAIHRSTIRKVEVIHSVANRAYNGTLITDYCGSTDSEKMQTSN